MFFELDPLHKEYVKGQYRVLLMFCRQSLLLLASVFSYPYAVMRSYASLFLGNSRMNSGLLSVWIQVTKQAPSYPFICVNCEVPVQGPRV